MRNVRTARCREYHLSDWLAVTQSRDASTVARWIVDELCRKGSLFQDDVVALVHERFGVQFTVASIDGRLTISPDVQLEIRKLTGDVIVWERRKPAPK